MTSFGCIAFYVATLEMAVVSAKNEVEGKTTLLDECMLLMTKRPDLGQRKLLAIKEN